MLSVSSKWARALTADHGLAVKVNALYGGSVVAQDIPFVDGAVRVDRGSDVRRSLSLAIAAPASFPFGPTDRYGVYGQRLYVERGIRYIDGSTELVPLGQFVITNVSGNIHTGPLTIAAAGQEILLKRTLFETATSTSGYASAAAFIAFHIPNALPGASFVNASTNGATAIATKTWDSGTDVWTALTEVATSVGAELFCDAYGTFRLVNVPDVATASPVWDVTTGSRGVMVSADVSLSSDDVFNRVVASGENAEDNTPPVRATATITDPADPLRYGGPFGKVTKAYSSSLITNASKAQSAANAQLSKYRAPNRTVNLSTVPNPALDAGDCIRVNYGPGISPELHIVQSFSVPLSTENGAFTIATVGGRDEV